jgi:hypothetical protein
VGASLHAVGLRDRGGFAEEAIGFKQAFVLRGWGNNAPTANPHFFNYPSLSIYLHWAVQWLAGIVGIITGRYGRLSDAGVEYALDPGYLVGAARLATFACLAATAWLAYGWWRSRSRAIGAVVACLLCVSPPLIRSAGQLTPEGFMGPGILLAMLLLRRATPADRTSYLLCGLVAGMVCGIKYSALPLAAMCVVVGAGIEKSRGPVPARIALGMSCVASGFLISTPFAALAWPEFRRDVLFEAAHLAGGHMGGTRAHTLAAHLGQLWAALSVPFLCSLVGVMLLPKHLNRWGALALLAGATFVLPAMGATSGGPERYLVPCIPLMWLFISESAHALLIDGRWAPRAIGGLCVVGSLLLLVVHASSTMTGAGSSPVAEASDWVRVHVTSADVIVAEYGALAVFSKDDQAALLASNCLANASAAWQARAKAAPARAIVTIPFVASGTVGAVVEGADGAERYVSVFDPGWRIVPQLAAVLSDVPVQYVVTNANLDARLESSLSNRLRGGLVVPHGELVFAGARSPGAAGGTSGISVYRGPSRAPDAPSLPAGWWARDAREPDASASLAQPARAERLAREQVFRERVRPYLLSLALATLARRDDVAASSAARLMVISDSTDVVAIRVALLAIDDGGQATARSRDGVTPLGRERAETRESWLCRILVAWGVEPARAASEVDRFVRWRGSAKPASPA